MSGAGQREEGRPLLSREESARRVLSMLGGAITPTVFWLHDGEFEARLTVDPDIAWDALRAAGEA